MKYYSETLKQLFDTEEALQNAESIAENEKIKKEETKKELAKMIEASEEALDKAYEAYEVAKDECAKILDESNKQVESILQGAKEAISVAETNRMEAIKKFNKNFGPYKTSYSSERAKREAERINSIIDGMFKMFW